MSGLQQYIGSKISITLHNDSLQYEGIIHAIDEKARKIVLKKVVDGDGTRYASHQVFYADDVLDLVVLNDPRQSKSSESSDKESSEDKSENSAKGSPSKENTRSLWKEFIVEEDDEPEPKKDLSDDGYRLIDRPYQDPYTYLIGEYAEGRFARYNSGLMPSAQYIDAFGKKFDAAVASISQQRVVGLSAEGTHLSRFGSLSLLVFGCVERVYVFDVFKLGNDCLEDSSLKSILESPHILKVIHDCRCLSDYLYHKANISLNNVFDTQVADIIVYKQTRGHLPSVLSGLLSSLNEHLHIVPDDSTYRHLWVNHTLRANASWDERPLKEEVIIAAAEQVVYLRELRNILIEKMLMEFLHGVDLYLGHYRDAPDKAVKTKVNNQLPRGFNRLGKLEESRQGRYKRKDEEKFVKSFERKDNHPTANESDQPKPRTSHWVGKDDFSDHYHGIHGRIVEMINDYDDNSREDLSDDSLTRVKRDFGQAELANRNASDGNNSTEDTEDPETIDMAEVIVTGSRSNSPMSNSSVDVKRNKIHKAGRSRSPQMMPKKFEGLRLKELDLIKDDASRSPSESGSGSEFCDSEPESGLKRYHKHRERRHEPNKKRGSPVPHTYHGGARSPRSQRHSPHLYVHPNCAHSNERMSRDRSNSSARSTPDFVKEDQNSGVESAGSRSEYMSGVGLKEKHSPKSIFKESEFPTLEEVSKRKTNTGLSRSRTASDPPNHRLTSNMNDPKIGIASIPSSARASKVGLGRAKLMDHYIQHPMSIPGGGKTNAAARGLAAVPFPTDRELLRTPLVAEAAGPVPGQIVTVKRVVND